ncbi:MAG: hypothetical protein A3K19_07835 [Lentisphaerae bacterium RIFOXYB12_FULL_65_16]|nr:MAG: hypothetical protein A3K18_18100 [Lentisphaerae bacterium RIFOXYA12_64_32]OGV87557.1 MAG: hypothetical protein A3K19_07835 [Lentisphaerae bacterium RIFOXYB12_FULL_65_16]
MLTTVKGIYKDGTATPLEKVDLSAPSDVLIVFLGEHESAPRPRQMQAAGTWSDLDTETLKARVSASRAISSRKAVRL